MNLKGWNHQKKSILSKSNRKNSKMSGKGNRAILCSKTSSMDSSLRKKNRSARLLPKLGRKSSMIFMRFCTLPKCSLRLISWRATKKIREKLRGESFRRWQKVCSLRNKDKVCNFRPTKNKSLLHRRWKKVATKKPVRKTKIEGKRGQSSLTWVKISAWKNSM